MTDSTSIAIRLSGDEADEVVAAIRRIESIEDSRTVVMSGAEAGGMVVGFIFIAVFAMVFGTLLLGQGPVALALMLLELLAALPAALIFAARYRRSGAEGEADLKIAFDENHVKILEDDGKEKARIAWNDLKVKDIEFGQGSKLAPWKVLSVQIFDERNSKEVDLPVVDEAAKGAVFFHLIAHGKVAVDHEDLQPATLFWDLVYALRSYPWIIIFAAMFIGVNVFSALDQAFPSFSLPYALALGLWVGLMLVFGLALIPFFRIRRGRGLIADLRSRLLS